MSRGRLLITSGPTREYLDPVRYLSNGSSGRMGSCLANAALDAGFDVTIVSGPVHVEYPGQAEVVSVTSTMEMLERTLENWPSCVGLIAAAAPSDFRPKEYSASKIKKTNANENFTLEFIENPDILAQVGINKRDGQWTVGFALETENGFENAKKKLEKKNCDYIVLNEPSAIDSRDNSVSIISASGRVVDESSGSKAEIAKRIVSLFQ